MRRSLYSLVACSLLIASAAAGCSDDPKTEPTPDTGAVDERDASDTDSAPDDGGDTDEQPDPDTADPSPDTDDRPDPDTLEADPDAGDADAGPDCTVDSDNDGMTDCAERRYGSCLDPHDGDTDGDHLGDFEEFQKGTDPCAKDSDGDGLDDNVEVNKGLDPTRVSTWNDGVADGERWIVEACDEPETEPVIFEDNRTGNWRIALPNAFQNTYREPTITNPSGSTFEAAAVYDDTTNEVSGFLLSRQAPAAQTSPKEPLNGHVEAQIAQLSSDIGYDITGSEFTTHGGKLAASADFEITTTDKKSARKLRAELLRAIGGYSRNDLSGMPTTAGKPRQAFRVQVTVTERNHTGQKTSNLYSVAVAPLPLYKSLDKVVFRVDDLTNTTNVADFVYEHRTECVTREPSEELPASEFYWVLDQSASMSDYNNTIRQFASQFEQRVRNTRLDYRFGVTNMDPANDGRLAVPPGWHRGANVFAAEIRDRVTDCTGCNLGAEHGLSVGYRGLRHMLGTSSNAEKIRSTANTIAIFMTDSGTQGTDVAAAKQFFANTDDVLAFAITPPASQPDCETDPDEPKGNYEEVALNSGGAYSNLCNVDLEQTIETIIRRAAFLDEDFTLGETPISSSLRVRIVNEDRKTATWVPRSREDGFDYSSEENSLAFFGKYRPEHPKSGPPDWVAISFKQFHNGCKYDDQPPGVDTCSVSGP